MHSELSNFVNMAILDGGNIVPLIVPSDKIIGPSLTNPSIYNLNGQLLVNLLACLLLLV